MKTTDLDFSRNERVFRGSQAARRATSRGHRVADTLGNDVEPVLEWLFDGATVVETEDGVKIIIGGGAGGGVGTSSGSTVAMRNNSGGNLLAGDVVVVDETADNAVTTTSIAGDTRIVGVVQEPIADGAIGKVLFNGFTATINAPGAVRGEYAQTSTTTAEADSTTDRESGSFAVYLTGSDFPDFVTDSATTQADTPVSSLSINLPAVVPVDRALFLALWLDPATTDDIDIPGWVRIGSDADYYYFYRLSTGGDTATATWTDPSVAFAAALLLHPAVSLAVPIEDHDYDSTTSAAALAGLADAAHYAIAGVDADVATPGSGFFRLAGGAAGFTAGGTPALVQSTALGTTSQSFSSTLTGGNVMLAIPFTTADDTWSTDPRQGGTCPQDSNMTKFGVASTNFVASSGVNSTAILGKVVSSGDTYSGPFSTRSACEANASVIALLEFENIGISGYEVAFLEGQQDDNEIDLGMFTVGADDLLVMAFTSKRDGYSTTDPVVSPNGFTQVIDQQGIVNGWTWLGYKVGDGDASITYSNNEIVGPGGIFGAWAAIAVLLKNGASNAAGTLAGKYIGHDATATSPFTGGSQQNDAILALNLLSDAKPSALLYGPDLFGGEAVLTSEPLILEDGTIAILENGHAAMSEPYEESEMTALNSHAQVVAADSHEPKAHATTHQNGGSDEIDVTGLTGAGGGTDPQFTTIELGHASDTTIARASAGNLTVEGNALYRAGGTDVAVADGGTGASTASAARTNLGVAIGSDVQAFDADIPTVAASQAEMEAGTEAALRSVSPLRVAQAIAALGGGGGGGGYSEGTSFPGSPATNDKFFRNDLGMLFFYDGTRWLSTQIFTYNGTPTGSLTAALNTYMPLRSDYDIYVLDFATSSFCGSIDGSNYWVMTLNKVTAGNTPTSIGSHNMSAASASTWTDQVTAVNAVVAQSAHKVLALLWDLVGSPGGLFASVVVRYRRIAT